MKVEKSIIIGSSKGRVWDVLTDFQNYPLWLGSNEKVAVDPQKTIGKGFTYYVIGILPGIKYKTFHKVVEWKEDEKLVVYIKSQYGEGYATYTLDWMPGGCEVTYTLDVTLSKKFQSNQSLIHRNFIASVEETLYKLKTYLEKIQLKEER